MCHSRSVLVVSGSVHEEGFIATVFQHFNTLPDRLTSAVYAREWCPGKRLQN